MALDRFSAIIVDPEGGNRIRLKQAASAVPEFDKVAQIANLNEALAKLEGSEETNVIFLSNKAFSADIPQFIKNAKGTPHGELATYILILSQSEQADTSYASAMLQGADGFLIEPYSVDALLEITRISAKVRKERLEAREAVAIKFLMQEISDQVNTISELLTVGGQVLRPMRKLRQMCEIFQTLDDATRAKYLSSAVEVFEAAHPPLPRAAYKGVSSRVKKRLENKIIAQLEPNQSSSEEPGS